MQLVQLGGKSAAGGFAIQGSSTSSANPISLDLAFRSNQQMFAITPAIDGARTWSLTRVHPRLAFFKCRFTLAAGAIGTNQEFPANWKLSDALWEAAVANMWVPDQAGEYTMTGEFNGTDWDIRIFGPLR